MKKLVIVAIGGNALIKDNNHQSVEDQYEKICEVVRHVADMVEEGYEVVVTHGNGPQVGFGLRRAEIANEVKGMANVPLVNCVADTQGGIGYQIQQALGNEFIQRGMNKQVVSIITQVEVSPNDPKFKQPTKPIGSFYTEKQIKELTKKHPTWTVVEDSGRGYRRVVPSPKPINIVEKDIIKSMVGAGYVVIAAGGGGIPVIKTENNTFTGIDAVIDKDFATSLLAEQIDAETLIITTGVPQVYTNFGKPNQKALDEITIEEAKKHIDDGQFPDGSMLPKIKASLSFLENNGTKVIITNPESLQAAMNKQTGTHITK